MTKSYQITIVQRVEGKPTEIIHPVTRGSGGPLRLQAQADATYTLTDTASGRAPQQLHTRRRGKHLLVQIDDFRSDDSADLVLEDFYDLPAGSFTGVAEDGESYRFIPNTAEPQHQIGSLAEGDRITQVLGGSVFVAAAPVAIAAAPLAAVAGLGGGLGTAGIGAAALGVLALAGAGGGGSGEGSASSSTGTTGTPAGTLLAAMQSGDDTGVSSTDGLTRQTQPTLQGKATPGNKLTVKVDDGNEVPIGLKPDGSWDWTVPQALPPGKHKALIQSVDPKGDTETQTIVWEVDTSPLTAEIKPANSLESALQDQVLNTPELVNNLPITLTLDSKPNRPLTEADLEVVGGTLQPGSFRMVDVRNYTATILPTLSPATNDGQVRVSLKPPASSPLTDEAGNALAPVTSTTRFDNKALGATITHNQSELDKPGDGTGTLNIAELKDGVKFTLELDSKPQRALVAADVLTLGGRLAEGSFKVVANSDNKKYEMVVLAGTTGKPTADDGKLQLKLQPASTLTDEAGNPSNAASSSEISYDNLALIATLTSNQASLIGADKVLNTVESGKGVLFTIHFNGVPKRVLEEADLVVTGGSLEANSLKQISPVQYTAVARPRSDANNGELKLSVQPAAGKPLTDAQANPLDTSNISDTVAYDTKGLSASITSNFSDLDKTVKDDKLNAQEVKDGVTFKIVFDNAPASQFTADHLRVTGGSLQAGSWRKVSDTEYTVGVQPLATTTDSGSITLSLNPTTPLTDPAGTALSLTSSSPVLYDNKAPQITQPFDEAIERLPSNASFPILVTPLNDAARADIQSIKAVFLGEEKVLNKSALPAAGWEFVLTQAGLATPMDNGYYTFKLIVSDLAGNQTSTDQVFLLNRGSFTRDPEQLFVSTGASTTGTNGDDLFINSSGKQTFTGNGAADRFIWLARDRGTPNNPDVDTITDFALDNSVNGEADKLDLRDLLGGLKASQASDLSKYLKLEHLDTADPDTVADALKLSISSQGQFKGDAEQDPKVTDQVIWLSNIQTAATLESMSASGNLVWAITSTQALLG